MNTEFEIRFFPINIDKIRLLLERNEAKLIKKLRMMRRQTFNFPDILVKSNEKKWARIRDEGNKITLALKKIEDKTITGSKELEINVSNFHDSCLLLKEIGFMPSSYQESKREEWEFLNCLITIDLWPGIMPLMEIEAKDEKTVLQACLKLGLNINNATYDNISEIYAKSADISEKQFNKIKILTFENANKILYLKKT